MLASTIHLILVLASRFIGLLVARCGHQQHAPAREESALRARIGKVHSYEGVHFITRRLGR